MEIIIDKDAQPLVLHIVDETNTDLDNSDKSRIVINGLMAEVIKLNIEKERIQTEAEHKHAEYLQQLIDDRKAADEQIKLDKIAEDDNKAKMAEQKRQDRIADAERLYKIKMEEEEKKRQAKEQEDIQKRKADENKQMWITIGEVSVAIAGIISIIYGATKK